MRSFTVQTTHKIVENTKVVIENVSRKAFSEAFRFEYFNRRWKLQNLISKRWKKLSSYSVLLGLNFNFPVDYLLGSFSSSVMLFASKSPPAPSAVKKEKFVSKI